MWCDKCKYGGEGMKHSGKDFKCPICGNKTTDKKSPFPKNRTASIHPGKQKTEVKEKVTIVK